MANGQVHRPRELVCIRKWQICQIHHLWEPASVSKHSVSRKTTNGSVDYSNFFVLDLLVSINCVHDSLNSSTQHLTQPLCTFYRCEGHCNSWTIITALLPITVLPVSSSRPHEATRGRYLRERFSAERSWVVFSKPDKCLTLEEAAGLYCYRERTF